MANYISACLLLYIACLGSLNAHFRFKFCYSNEKSVFLIFTGNQINLFNEKN